MKIKQMYKVETYCHHCNNSDMSLFSTKKDFNNFLKDCEENEIEIVRIKIDKRG